MSNKRFRQTLRWLHIIVGVMLIAYVYSPLGEVTWYALLVQAPALPLATLSGLALRQQPELSARFKKGVV